MAEIHEFDLKLTTYEEMLIHEAISERVKIVGSECPCSDCTLSDCPIVDDMTYCTRHKNWIQKLRALKTLEWKADHSRIKYYVEN